MTENDLWKADAEARKRKDLLIAEDRGAMTVVRTARVDPVFEHVRYYSDRQNTVAPAERSKLGVYLGSIDGITAAQWAKECGAAIGTREFAAYAKKKLMSPDWQRYRADTPKTVYGVS